MNGKLCHIDWEPVGIRSDCIEGKTILAASQEAGLSITAFCGGAGNCKSCKIIVRSGTVNEITPLEKSCLTDAEKSQGIRLACCTQILSDLRIDIPVSSLLTSQRLQMEGQDITPGQNEILNIERVNLRIDPPSIDDLRSDTKRLKDVAATKGFSVNIRNGLLHSISDILRKNDWNVDVILQNNTIIHVCAKNEEVYGVAFDIGTTKIAAYLIDMSSRSCIGKGGRMNPQISYGEDVVSRIAFANDNVDGRDTLQKVLIKTLNDLILELCEKAHTTTGHIIDIVAVCNTAIHHFFLNYPVKQLGAKPYVPAVSDPVVLAADSLGLLASPGAQVYVPKNIAGYVGADHVSMLVGCKAPGTGINRIALDIGTNTEISLITKDGSMFCCSCASGPAFEGAHIKNGMRAADGAIEKAMILNQELKYKTINNKPAIGICGSGILDIIAELKTAGAIDERGRFSADFPNVLKNDKSREYQIAENISITRSDINEIILAKSAIRAGLEVLLQSAGLKDDDIDEFIIAGAFGTYLDVKNAIEIGMFPDIPFEKFVQVGNAAGTGAQKFLLSQSIRIESEKMETKYVELGAFPDFMKILVGCMNLVRGNQ